MLTDLLLGNLPVFILIFPLIHFPGSCTFVDVLRAGKRQLFAPSNFVLYGVNVKFFMAYDNHKVLNWAKFFRSVVFMCNAQCSTLSVSKVSLVSCTGGRTSVSF